MDRRKLSAAALALRKRQRSRSSGSERSSVCILWPGILFGIIFLTAPATLADNAKKPSSGLAVIITSYNAPPFQEAVEGLLEGESGKDLRSRYKLIALKGEPHTLRKLLNQLDQSQIKVAITIGSLATRTLKIDRPDIATVACLVLNAEEFTSYNEITSVYLEHAMSTQLHWLKEIIPEGKTVGLLYSPKENDRQASEASRQSTKLSLILESRAISATQQIPPTLEQLANRINVLWGIPDTLVLTPQTARQILLFSFRHRIPFVGPSASWVKAGALYALDWDYRDLGRQCATMAQRVLSGEKPGTIPPMGPRKVIYYLNAKTAAHMKITIPEAILQAAGHVY
jgi:putative tryptophan/tyrosine transport system substrate-binding protein